MTTEDRIEVMEECAKLACRFCASNTPRRQSSVLTDFVHLSEGAEMGCHAAGIVRRIVALRKTLEPPIAEEWAEHWARRTESVIPIGDALWLRQGYALLERHARAKGGK